MEQESDLDQVSAATQHASMPVTTRIPILPLYSFSQAPLQVHPCILCAQLISITREALRVSLLHALYGSAAHCVLSLSADSGDMNE